MDVLDLSSTGWPPKPQYVRLSRWTYMLGFQHGFDRIAYMMLHTGVTSALFEMRLQ